VHVLKVGKCQRFAKAGIALLTVAALAA